MVWDYWYESVTKYKIKWHNGQAQQNLTAKPRSQPEGGSIGQSPPEIFTNVCIC